MKKVKYVLIAAVALAIGVTSFAVASGENTPIKGGARNPSSNPSLSYTKETEIIADNSGYGTRQSNKGSGGGAIYGCRATAATVACLRATNISTGQAFQVATDGKVGGTITAVGGDAAVPFTTNATGVATGLNADRVDSMNATDIENATRALSPFGVVAANGTLTTGKGVASSVNTSPGNYTVVFSSDVSKCAITATESTISNAGAVGTQVQSDGKTVFVRTRHGGDAGGMDPTDVDNQPFDIIAEC